MNRSHRLLVVEDDEAQRVALCRILKGAGYRPMGAGSVSDALAAAEQGCDVVLSDLRLGEQTAIDLLKSWQKIDPRTRFVVITGDPEIRSAVEAMKAGAYDYISKPVDSEELVLAINRALESVRSQRQIDRLRQKLDQQTGMEQFIGQSPRMQEVFNKIRRAAAVDSTVLILGESGTGKELVAQALHRGSPRSQKPFVAVNCAAVPATLVESELFGHVRGAFTGALDRRLGRFEQAHEGTLFIDEIGDFELGLQAKLLRVLETLVVTPVGGHEERKVDVRVLAATSRNVQQMMKDGTFREDLFYRLNVVTITLPPLRDRRDDIPLLVDHFVQVICRQNGREPCQITPEAMERLIAYHWPGNVRELRNALESTVVLADSPVIDIQNLPEKLRG